jgi:hypothetical protein
MGESLMGFWTQLVMLIISVASTAYQMVQASKKKVTNPATSDAAAQARLGFELPTEGRAEFLPKVYGKAKVGGVRVYHNTTSAFKYTSTNADRSFQTGPTSIAGGTFSRVKKDVSGNLYNEVENYASIDSGELSKDIEGTKNEFLFFQQALCQAPINGIIDVIIDESRHLDDPALGSFKAEVWSKVKAAMRIDIHNTGNASDSIMSANFSERLDAKFKDIAYASVVIRLDRDDPQFSSVPALQFLMEGSLVRKVIGGVLSTTYVYSNNPAWCLLDYLLDTKSGKGVNPLTEVDLASFEDVAAVCEMIVQQDAIVGGKLYQPTDDSRNIYTRDLPLYECNLITDPKKSIRDNIESILETMGDARLVWSGGKYKLSLQYPANNQELNVAATITDDVLSLDQSVEINWPTASQRFNNCTLRFHNECEDFKEDSVSWPPKVTTTIFKGIGGFNYSPSIGEYDEDTAGGRLLNKYGVWSGGGTTTTLDYKFLVSKIQSGACTLTISADSAMTLTIKDDITNTVIYTLSSTAAKSINTLALNLGNANIDKVYSIHITASGGSKTRAVSASITSTNYVIWTTRTLAYTAFVTNVLNSAVYDEMLIEDSGLVLELDMFSEGITDAYHALAKAEELVRTSRSAFGLKFSYVVKSVYLEPGDYISINSDTLLIGSGVDPLYFRVESVKITEENTCEVFASRFDYTQLAWSIKDDQYPKPPPVYDSRIPAPEWIEYTPQASGLTNSSGYLNWASVSLVDTYVLYVHTSNDLIDENGIPVFTEIGRTPTTSFSLPLLNATSAYFGVKASLNGRLSQMTYTDTSSPILLDQYTYSFTNLSFTYNSPSTNQISWNNFTITLNGIVTKNISAGNATWTSDHLYIYYNPISNLVLSTTLINIANSGKLLAIYDGGNNLVVKVSNLDPPINLYVKDTTAGIYSNKDLELTWEYPLSNDNKTDVFSHYLIQLYTTSNVLKHSEKVEYSTNRSGYYKLLFSNNINYFGTATRSFIVKVYSVDISGSLSSAITLTVNNPVPTLTAWTVLPSFNSVSVKITNSAELDINEYRIYKSPTPNFTKDSSTLVYAGKETYVNINALGEVLYYYSTSITDTFGDAGISFSQEQSAMSAKTDPDTYTYTGLTFVANHNAAQSVSNGVDSGYALNNVYWSAFTVSKNGGTASSLPAGTAAWTTGVLYIYYIPGDTVLRTNVSLLGAITAGGRILATYKGGTDLTHDEGRAFVSGDQLLAGTVGANALVTNTAVITNSAQVGNILESSNYSWTTGNYAGWRIDKTGYAQFGGLTIRKSNGDLVMSAGNGVEWDTGITGTGKPADGATVGGSFGGIDGAGGNISGTINSGNASTYIADAAIGTAQIGSLSLTGTDFSYKSSVNTSADRIEMDSQSIRIYAANPLGGAAILRVRLGNLS